MFFNKNNVVITPTATVIVMTSSLRSSSVKSAPSSFNFNNLSKNTFAVEFTSKRVKTLKVRTIIYNNNMHNFVYKYIPYDYLLRPRRLVCETCPGVATSSLIRTPVSSSLLSMCRGIKKTNKKLFSQCYFNTIDINRLPTDL